MRRHDFEITSDAAILDILRNGTIVHIAFIDGSEPYMVTMNYGLLHIDGVIYLYLHSAREGRKIDCASKHPRVCFSVVAQGNLTEGKSACSYGFKYRSVVGYGTIRIVDDEKEKKAGLDLLMKQYTGREDWSYETEALDHTLVLCIEVDEFAGKGC